MQALAYAMIASVLLVEYLQGVFGLPRALLLVPDALSAVAAAAILAHGASNRFRDVDGKYFIILLLLLANVVAGVVANAVSPGVVLNGIRTYLRAIPFFVLPLVVAYVDAQVRRQILLIAGIAIIQLPIAWMQRQETLAAGSLTGDLTVGTLVISSILSIFICSAAAVAVGMYFKRQISLKALVVYLFLTLPVTMINETKGSLLLLPIALLVPALALRTADGRENRRRIVTTVVAAAVFAALFVPVYDHFMKPRWGYGILDFIQMEGRVERYLDKGAELGSTDSGKWDSIWLPLKAADGDIAKIGIGVGIGNMSPSALGQGFEGEYFKRYGHLVGPSVSVLFWETGIVGVVLTFLFLLFILQDALRARRLQSSIGGLALGWVGVVCVMLVGMFYKLTIQFDSLTYLFCFYSGVVAAASARMTKGAVVSRGMRN